MFHQFGGHDARQRTPAHAWISAVTVGSMAKPPQRHGKCPIAARAVAGPVKAPPG